jgi:hypothetical protein
LLDLNENDNKDREYAVSLAYRGNALRHIHFQAALAIGNRNMQVKREGLPQEPGIFSANSFE